MISEKWRKCLVKDGNKYLVWLMVEEGCSYDDGEYWLSIVKILHGSVGEYDFDLVDECVREDIESSDIPSGGSMLIEVSEAGEWDDVIWHKFYYVTNKDYDGQNKDPRVMLMDNLRAYGLTYLKKD